MVQQISLGRLVDSYRVSVEATDVPLSDVTRQRSNPVAERTLRLRDLTTHTLLFVFIAGSTASMALFFLTGFGVTNLSDTALASLAATSIAEVGGLLTIVLNGLFPQSVDS